MARRKIIPEAEAQNKAAKKKDKKKLKDAVDKITTTCGLTNPEKKALKRALTDEET